MERREFIRLIGLGAAGGLLLNQFSCDNNNGFIPVDFFIDLSDPQYASLLVTGGYEYFENVIIFKGIDFNYYALSKICTHTGCSVTFQLSKNELVCPCHGSQFDTFGNVTIGPAPSPLFQYSTELSGTLLRVFSP